ncbi:glycoside hydrolase family 9 protein [Chondrinema litorale]|uniref:glycoside hydrolase family 9 protein n=1 Tax=Chondrinema litorale TaxID=2994555 RepID=UPI0025427643|nr:glycoside hydrolase family 9 protein [Chondrinema litorale]UZR97076.1 glycoside hydrolase family 9 protein [Chondrinema litorale]
MNKLYISLIFIFSALNTLAQQGPYIRINQIGYLPDESKIAIVFSEKAVSESFYLIDDANQKVISSIKLQKTKTENWGKFKYYYTLDFTEVKQEGTYFLKGKKSGNTSSIFDISSQAYDQTEETVLVFMRQQRCGYNPFLDMVCHQRDGRAMDGPMPDSTFVDVSGGWHDAGDQLKYLITGSYATAHMLMTYELFPERFGDKVNHLGQPEPNGIPDVLDEAKWGLDWIHRLHPKPDQLFHQVADDRDHRGWKMPDEDVSDYGWGANSYRVAYFATGKPQGLNKYKSEATGIANLAGRSAAAMALAARIWEAHLNDADYANKCREAAISLYAMGTKQEGYQQGNSYGAPYRYNEETWSDDMEWAAAELYKLTEQESYLTDAKRYAKLTNTTSWMELDSAAHYQYYPFINMGHYALYDQVEPELKDSLAAYYKAGIEKNFKRAQQNPYGIGVPFIWCSNNLLTSLIAQVILYEKMTGDLAYHQFLVEQRDWLFGRNPWGTSMFMNMPQRGEYPVDVHTSIWALTKQEVPGGLVDGPVFASIYQSLKGLTLSEQDEFAHVQNKFVVYHDDIGDYSTNEPTMDGTAGAILMMAYWGVNEK